MTTSSDRISNLPDDIIRQILSRLRTKYAVRTSILSRNWGRKWTSIYDIDVYNEHKSMTRQNKFTSFVSFLDGVLGSTHDSRLRSFRLSSWRIYKFNRLKTWISGALKRNVQYLEISELYFECRQSILLPQRLSSFSSLTELKISLNCTLKVSVNNCFPNLKSLYLSGKGGKIEIRNDESPHSNGGHILLVFPALEVLELRRCKWLNVTSVEIRAPELIRFKGQSMLHLADYKIKICGAKLVEFESSKGHMDNYDLSEAPSINYAYFDHWPDFEFPVSGFQGLKRLKLSDIAVQDLILAQPEQVLPTFDRLRELEICNGSVSTRHLLEFLQVLPSLESLILNLDFWLRYNYDQEESLPPCITFQLKEVKFIDFGGTNSQTDLVKFILRNAKNEGVCLA